MRRILTSICVSLTLASCGGGSSDTPAAISSQSPQLTAASRVSSYASDQTARSDAGNFGHMQGRPRNHPADAAPTTSPSIPDTTSPLQPINRSTVDQADDAQGPQVHVIYAIPSDGVDRAFDLSGTLTNTTGSFNNWLATQTDGRKLRVDTYNGSLDITFVKLPKTDAAYDTFGLRKRDQIEEDLKILGVLKPDKIYAAYYDGGNTNTCADAPRPPDLPGQVGIMYLKGAVPGFIPCFDNQFAASPTAAPGFLDFAMLHEILHTMGIVSDGAPNQVLNGHVDTDPTDLMYAGPLPWDPKTLDVNRSNYYNPNGLPAGIFNLAESAYLLPRPSPGAVSSGDEGKDRKRFRDFVHERKHFAAKRWGRLAARDHQEEDQ